MALCVPIEILTGKWANRATRESSFEDFNLTVVKPLQKRYVRQLKEAFRDRFTDDEIEEIELIAVDTKNQEEMSKVADRLVRCGVFSLDEAREFVGLEATWEPQDQVRQVYNSGSSSTADKEIEDVEEFVKTIMKKKQWNQ
jgi:polyhydroxyalkanoate synthesis regulator phasin